MSHYVLRKSIKKTKCELCIIKIMIDFIKKTTNFQKS